MTRRWSLSAAALLAAALLATAAVAGGCTGPDAQSQGGKGATTKSGVARVEPRPQYIQLAEAVVAGGGRVWVETDLAKAWLDGTDRYQEVLGVVVALADRKGVDGVKIADELGYDDGLSAEQARKFLARTTADLHRELPGRKVMVDMIVPELGCMAWHSEAATEGMRGCAQQENADNPATTIAAVDSYLGDGGLDVLNLSAGLRSDGEYTAWGTTRDDAMTAIWAEAAVRWGSKVTLQARKALAHPGAYRESAAQAEADVHTFVDIPLAHGASAVDIWSWSQPYKGGTYQLTDPGLKTNALMAALNTRRAQGVQLWTHMTPSSLQQSLEKDVTSALSTFGTILVASGTG